MTKLAPHIDEVRAMLAEGATLRRVAAKFGVTHSTVHRTLHPTQPPKTKVGPPGTKWCERCDGFQPLDRFGPNAARCDGRQTYCRSHQNEANKASQRRAVTHG